VTVPAKPPIFVSGGVKQVVDTNLVPAVPSFGSAGTREPDSAVKLPNIAIRLPETTTRLPETTTRLTETTTRLPETRTRLPETTTRLPDTKTRLPESTTRLPETTTRLLATTTRPSETATRLPETATRPSEIAIKPEAGIDAMPEVVEGNSGSGSHLLADVSMPETTTNIPVTTSGLSREETSVDIRLPDVVSQVLDAATLSQKLPKNATKGLESTHNAAEVVTQVPGLTIEIPSTGTKVTELTTQVPEVAPQVAEANNVVLSEPLASSSDIDNEITSDEDNDQVIDFSGELKSGQ
jgi:hypothetical protein